MQSAELQLSRLDESKKVPHKFSYNNLRLSDKYHLVMNSMQEGQMPNEKKEPHLKTT